MKIFRHPIIDHSEISISPSKHNSGRRLTHELIKVDDLNLDNVDPNMMENEESDSEKPNYNVIGIILYVIY